MHHAACFLCKNRRRGGWVGFNNFQQFQFWVSSESLNSCSLWFRKSFPIYFPCMSSFGELPHKLFQCALFLSYLSFVLFLFSMSLYGKHSKTDNHDNRSNSNENQRYEDDLLVVLIVLTDTR